MKEQTHKYTIQQNDTLEKIAFRCGLSVRELLDYHNDRCKVSEVIVNELPFYQKYILIPSGPKEQPPKRVLTNCSALNIKPYFKTVSYGVSIQVEKEGKPVRIKYTVSLRRIHDKNGMNKVELIRLSPPSVNNRFPEGLAERLAIEVTNALYPIVFVTDDYGWLETIDNFNSIRERWQTWKEKIRTNRQGKVLEDYLLLNDETYDNKRRLLNRLKADPFLQVFFFGIYRSYYGNPKYTITIPLITGEKEFRIKRRMDEYLDQTGRIIIRMEGQETEKEENTYQARYYVDPGSHTIDALCTEYTSGTCRVEIKAFSLRE